MNFENDNLNFDLLGKYLSGEASPEEAMLLHEWLMLPENKKAFDEFSKLWSLLPGPAPTPVLRGQSWAELKQEISKNKRPIVRRIFSNRLIVAACVIALAGLITVTWLVNDKEPGLDKPIETAFVTKGAANAVVADTMNDGSIVTINNGSTISYSHSFSKANRNLQLNGEAFFHVAPDKSNPFIISIDDLKIKVIGTSFNVRKLPAENIEVQVQEGVVMMYTAEKELLVTKNETGIYLKETRELKLKDSIDVNSIGYATRSFYFNDISLTEACKYLSHAFHVEFRLDQKKFDQCRITAQFKGESLEYILAVIDATLSTNSKRTGNVVYVNGNGCQ